MAGWLALTVTSTGGVLRVLETGCQVCAAFDPSTPPAVVQHHGFTAIWDTGATGSVITQEVVDLCGLNPTGMAQVHGVHGTEVVETFLVNIMLPNNVQIHTVTVTKGKLVGAARVLIGMDIISLGDLSITNAGGTTTFSFRVPSQKHIDYVKEANAINQGLLKQPHGGLHKKRPKPPKKAKGKRGKSRK